MIDGNKAPAELRHKLANHQWSPNTCLDLHKMGIHYYNPEYLPTQLDPFTYASYLRRGLTPPNALPVFVPEDTPERIKSFLDLNYFRLSMAGAQYLGNECNFQTPDKFDTAKLRVCFCRISDYETLDGAFGGQLVANFIRDFTDDIFCDFSYLPNPADIGKLFDAELPLMWGNIAKRPLRDYDILFIATSYPGERVNLPFALTKSGIPLYRWERWDDNLPYKQKMPLVCLAGIGAFFIENMLGDNPVKGLAGNAAADYIIIGEGEMADLQFAQEFLQEVIEGGKSKDEFAKLINNRRHRGLYDPTKVLFEYLDKEHVAKDFEGNELYRHTYVGGGHIRAIHLVDEENKTLHCLAGPEAEDFRDLDEIQQEFAKRFNNKTGTEVGQQYIKISDGLTLAQRQAKIDARKAADTTPAEKAAAGVGEAVKVECCDNCPDNVCPGCPRVLES